MSRKCNYFYRTLLDLNMRDCSTNFIREVYDKDSDLCEKSIFISNIESRLNKNEIQQILESKNSNEKIDINKIRKSKLDTTFQIFKLAPFHMKLYILFVYPVDSISYKFHLFFKNL